MRVRETNAFHWLRRVIGISDDGPCNPGGDAMRARAAALIETCAKAQVDQPEKILRNFVARYRG